MSKSNRSSFLKITLLLVIIFLLVIYYPQINDFYANAEKIIIRSGYFAPLIYTILIALAALIAPIPATPLIVVAGSLFGMWEGLFLTLLGATIGSTIAFLSARFFLRDIIEQRFSDSNLYIQIKKMDQKRLGSYLLFTRLMPQIPFDLISYLFGLTRMKIITFSSITFIGMIPMVFLQIFFGSFFKQYIVFIMIILLACFIFYLVFDIKSNQKNKS